MLDIPEEKAYNLLYFGSPDISRKEKSLKLTKSLEFRKLRFALAYAGHTQRKFQFFPTPVYVRIRFGHTHYYRDYDRFFLGPNSQSIMLEKKHHNNFNWRLCPWGLLHDTTD